MKKNRKLTLDQHRGIAEIVTNQRIMQMACDIPNTYGKTTKVARLAKAFSKTALSLQCEMENMAYKDGFSDVATDIYYPTYGPRLRKAGADDCF